MATVKRNKFNTSVCASKWPWLMVPDTKFNELGEYKVDLIMNPATAKTLCGEVLAEVKGQAGVLRAKDKELKDFPLAWPVKDDCTEDGEVTGDKLIAFRQKARVVREGQEDITYHVAVLDAKRNAMPPTIKLGSGTTMRICFQVRLVKDTLNKCIRIKFHPLAAQIITLVEWLQDFGFEDADGYTAPADVAANPTAQKPKDSFDEYMGEPEVAAAIAAKAEDAAGDDNIPF